MCVILYHYCLGGNGHNKLFFRMEISVQFTAWYQSIDTKTYFWVSFLASTIRLLYRYINNWAVRTKTQHKFPVRNSISVRCKITHYHGHVCFCFVYITNMMYHGIIIDFNHINFYFIVPSVLFVLDMVVSPLMLNISPC